MNTQLCITCGRSFQNSNNGVFVFEMFQEDKEIYRIWKADVKKCPKCGQEIISGLSKVPYAQHFDPEFGKLVKAIKESKNSIYYWYEK